MTALFWISLISCTGTKTDTSTEPSQPESNQPESPAVECAEISVEECEANDCGTLSGRPTIELLDGTSCINWLAPPVAVSCTNEMSAEAVISFASPAEGEVCYAFSSGTTPAGWVECAAVDECTGCDGLPEDQCEASEACASIGAAPMTPVGEDFCIDYSASGAVVGCKESGPCGDAETYARPPGDTGCWYFADTCIPEGWEYCGASGEECQ